MKTGEFYSSGKFLLTGEYLVMYGADALAVPLKPGQHLKVMPSGRNGMIQWTTFIQGNLWFRADLSIPQMEILQTNESHVAGNLARILKACARMEPDSFAEECGYAIESRLDFDIRWGLGSSSSLISNLAYWLGMDPYTLFRQLYPGSGYDVFTARARKPIRFRLSDGVPVVKEVDFHPPFNNQLYFVYLGKKQDSQDSVGKFKMEAEFGRNEIQAVTEITDLMATSSDISGFIRLMARHEELIAGILRQVPVGKSRFEDFPGGVKSLGAWGGDFILAASDRPESIVWEYFRSKGLGVIFRYDELVL